MSLVLMVVGLGGLAAHVAYGVADSEVAPRHLADILLGRLLRGPHHFLLLSLLLLLRLLVDRLGPGGGAIPELLLELHCNVLVVRLHLVGDARAVPSNR